MSVPNLSVWADDKVACIRITGRASFTCSVDFKTLVTGLWRQGRRRFVLDLTACPLMDSTFLGILANLGMRFHQEPNAHGPATIELVNPNPRIADLLENLGVAHFFKIVAGEAPPTDQLQLLEQRGCNPDKKEVSRACLEAHRFLMEVQPANVPKFKDVTRFLEEDLKRMEAGANANGTAC